MQRDGRYVIIESIEKERLAEPETTYNVEVADNHTYYVGNGILTHNKCRRVAMREAKRSENISMNAKPDQVILGEATIGADGKYYKPITYKFGNKYIRNDMGGHLFPDGVSMSQHYNAGKYVNGRQISNNLHFFYGG